MKKTCLNTEYESLLDEFDNGLVRLQWNIRNFFDEFYNTPTNEGGDGILNKDEIKQKYDAFRKAKSRQKVNLYELKTYINYIQNHHNFKTSQNIYANYISLGNLSPSTEKILKKISTEFTKEFMEKNDEM
ncbi:hypothetical protein RHO14_03270 [Orbus wheelerorum]|uniref:hypothetical protein n=1 Tax=Orbus wheelerorum TaxID=3074111 RepID=UPI00370D4A8C